MIAVTPSTMAALQSQAPPFRLIEPMTDTYVSLDDFAHAPALLVLFLANTCPYVKRILPCLVSLLSSVRPHGLAAVAINANDAVSRPRERPERMVAMARAYGFGFPYLYDECQTTAKAYHAACTPDFFLYDAGRRLVYRGRFDDSRPDNGIPVSGERLRLALDALLARRPLRVRQTPSLGCNIVWKPGNEPDYF